MEEKTYAHDADCNTPHEAGPEPCPPPRAKVNDVIEHGETIPANVAKVKDRSGDRWRRSVSTASNNWVLYEYRGEPNNDGTVRDGDEVSVAWGPLTVVEVDPEPQPADDLRTLLLPFWQECATSPDEPDNAALMRWVRLVVESERRAHRNLKDAFVRIEALQAERKPAESGPIVLTLPEVPAEAVALVEAVVRAARRWYYENGFKPGYLPRHTIGSTRDLKLAVEQLNDAGFELAPPREPRTWPKLDVIAADVRAVEVEGHGVFRRSRLAWTWIKEATQETWSEQAVRELGEVREVLE